MDKKSDKKIIVQLICVILSFSLWLYINNVENPLKDSVVKGVQVELENTESLKSSDMTIIDEDDYTVDISVSGPSNQVYNLNSDDFKLKVDLSQYALKLGENVIPIEVVDYPEGITIKNNNSLCIKVKVEAYTEKEVDIVSKVQLNYKTGFSVKSQNVSPSKIKVSGPESIVNKVDKAVIKGKIENVSQDINEEYDIVLCDSKDNEISGLELNQTKATLTAEIVQGKEVPIKASLNGKLKEGLSLESSELSVKKVTISGDSNIISSIDSISTSSIDISDLNSSQDIAVDLIVPDGVYIQNAGSKITISLKIKNTASVTKTIYGVIINYEGMDETKFSYEMPESCDIVVSGSQEDINNLKDTDILVSASLRDLNEEGTFEVTWKAELNKSNISLTRDTGNVSVKVTKK